MPGPRPGMTLRRQRGLGLLDDRLERRRLADREVGQHLAVDRDPGLAQARDKSAVGQVEGAHRRVEPLDPQGAERALAPLAVAECVLVGFLDRLLGDADRVLAPAVVTLGGLQNFLVLGMRGDAAFDPGHVELLDLSDVFVLALSLSCWAGNTS